MIRSLLLAILLFLVSIPRLPASSSDASKTNSSLGSAQGRKYLPVGKVCRPKNGDGYMIWSGEDTPKSCQAKCEADADRCGAWEFENWAVDNHECELHEKHIILPDQTGDQGECLISDDGSIDTYRCCWILEDIVQGEASEGSANVDGSSSSSLPGTTSNRPASSNGTNNSTSVSVPVRNYLPAGKVCRPLNDDGYMTWSGEDTPESCRAKCEADSDRCGAFEFENWAVDDHECELHEKVIILPQETSEGGECQISEDGSIDFYRCCWILEEIIREAENAEGSNYVYGKSSAARRRVVIVVGFASFSALSFILQGGGFT